MSKRGLGVNRREFIAAGSVAAAATLLPLDAFAAAPSRSTALALSVGFCSESQQALSVPAFEAAQSLLTGDGAFFSAGARLSFRGIHRVAGTASLRATVDVIYRPLDGSKVPFYAFTHVEGTGRNTSSTPAAFTVPVPSKGTVDLSFRARRGTQPESTAVISFAVNTAKGALKLNEGVYVFAFASSVDWRTVFIAEGRSAGGFVSGSDALLVTSGGRDVGFDYIVMTAGLPTATT